MELSNNKSTSRKLAVAGYICLLLLIVTILENLSMFIPGMPQVLQPTSPLFTVLKKGAV